MNNYALLLKLIRLLPSGTVFSITEDWLVANGVSVSPSDAKALGHKFANQYQNYGCICIGKGSNNLKSYKKI